MALMPVFKPKYSTLEEYNDLPHDFCETCRTKDGTRPASGLGSSTFWMLTACFLLLVLGMVIVFETVMYFSALRQLPAAAFSTELSTARSEVSFRPYKFTGNINFDQNGNTYLEQEPGSKLYSGPPNDEMDENWHDLLQKRYFYMTEAEVLDSWGPAGLQKYFYELGANGEKKYVGGLDVLHTLHCVEGLRQTLDPDRYKRRAKLHLYHCIDHIRQWIMCSGDFTPIPTRWHPEKNSSYVDTDQVHTCRNYDAVANWVSKREAA